MPSDFLLQIFFKTGFAGWSPVPKKEGVRFWFDKTKKEIAGLRYSSMHGDQISSLNNQLDEIVMAAEEATNNILESAEEIDSDLRKMQQSASTYDGFMLLGK